MTTDSQTPTIAELERLAEYQEQLPDSADAATVHEVKKAIIDCELARGLQAEEPARLQPELAATPKLIKASLAAIAELTAKAGS